MRNLGSEKLYIAPGRAARKWLALNTVTDWLHATVLTPHHSSPSRETREGSWEGEMRREAEEDGGEERCWPSARMSFVNTSWQVASEPRCSWLVRYSWAFGGTLLHGNLHCFKGGSRKWSHWGCPWGILEETPPLQCSELEDIDNGIPGREGGKLRWCGPPHISLTVGMESNFCKLSHI